MKLCWQTWPCMLNDALTFSIAVQTVRATSGQDPVLWGVTAGRHIETDYHRHTGISLKAPQPINEGKEGKEKGGRQQYKDRGERKESKKQNKKARKKEMQRRWRDCGRWSGSDSVQAHWFHFFPSEPHLTEPSANHSQTPGWLTETPR